MKTAKKKINQSREEMKRCVNGNPTNGIWTPVRLSKVTELFKNSIEGLFL